VVGRSARGGNSHRRGIARLASLNPPRTVVKENAVLDAAYMTATLAAMVMLTAALVTDNSDRSAVS